MNLTNSLFFGWINGIRIYKERRGLYHAQKSNRPGQAFYSGNLRDIQSALKGRIVKNRL